jgi:hypothetical protein
MSAHDVWYFEVSATIAGEERGFSWQLRARPARHGETIPAAVRTACEEHVSEIVDMSDLRDYYRVTSSAGTVTDWPYRMAHYVLTCNGREVVRSWAIRPVKPEIAVAS